MKLNLFEHLHEGFSENLVEQCVSRTESGRLYPVNEQVILRIMVQMEHVNVAAVLLTVPEETDIEKLRGLKVVSRHSITAAVP